MVALPPREWTRTAFNLLIWGGLAAALAWSWAPAEMFRIVGLYTDAGNMAEYASGFLKPNFRDLDFYIAETVLTVQIAIWGTVLAVIAALLFGCAWGALLLAPKLEPIAPSPESVLSDALGGLVAAALVVLYIRASEFSEYYGASRARPLGDTMETVIRAIALENNVEPRLALAIAYVEDAQRPRGELAQRDLVHRRPIAGVHSVTVGAAVRKGRTSSHSWIGSPPAPSA